MGRLRQILFNISRPTRFIEVVRSRQSSQSDSIQHRSRADVLSNGTKLTRAMPAQVVIREKRLFLLLQPVLMLILIELITHSVSDPIFNTDELLQELDKPGGAHRKRVIAMVKATLEDQQNQIIDLQNQLDNALSRWRICLENNHHSSSTTERTTTTTTESTTTAGTESTTTASTESTAITTAEGDQISHLITVIPDISRSYNNFALFGGKLYSTYSNNGLIGLKVHDALTGSFIEMVATPARYEERMALCHRKSQIYLIISHELYYANISQLEPNSSAPWQKLTWYGAILGISSKYLVSFALSDDCEEAFLIFYESELEIRRLSDGEILVSRNNWTERMNRMVGTNQRYYVSQSDKNNGSSYVVEYDRQLNELRRYAKGLQNGDSVSYYIHYLALHENGGIFVSSVRVIFVWPDFTSYAQIAPSIYFFDICYDPQLKLLGAIDSSSNVYVYNITLG